MSEIMRFETSSGAKVLVEAADDDHGVGRVSRNGIADLGRRFGDVLDGIRDAAADALDTFRTGPLKPDEIEIEFGVKLNAEAGAVIAKTATEGHFTIKLSWTSGPAA